MMPNDDFSLKWVLLRSAERNLDELISEKREEIKEKYKDDPTYIKTLSLIEERDQLIDKLDKVYYELDSLLHCKGISLNIRSEPEYILEYLSGLSNIRCKINDILKDYIAIEMGVPGFNPKHLLSKLNEMIKEEVSKINI